MGDYILCQHKKAGQPYYIENISANIFSIEELCFYLFHNIYLLDETILEAGLCRWIDEEIGMHSLTQKLRGLLETNAGPGDFILPIFKEAHYLSQAEYKEIYDKLQQLEGQPQMIRQKLKGDYLVRYGKYINAIKVYEKTLESAQSGSLGSQFKGSIYHNMGCAYAKLFQMDEALACFKNAHENLHTKKALKSYLFAVYIAMSSEDYEMQARELGVDDQTKQEIDQELNDNRILSDSFIPVPNFREAVKEKESGNLEGYYHSMDNILEQLTEDYHKNTGY